MIGLVATQYWTKTRINAMKFNVHELLLYGRDHSSDLLIRIAEPRRPSRLGCSFNQKLLRDASLFYCVRFLFCFVFSLWTLMAGDLLFLKALSSYLEREHLWTSYGVMGSALWKEGRPNS